MIHGLQRARLVCSWESPGKNTGSGWLCPSPGDLPDPGIQPTSLASPALAGEFFTTSTTWEAQLGRQLWGHYSADCRGTRTEAFISALMGPHVGHLTSLRTRVSSSKGQSLSEPICKDPALSILRYAIANALPTLVFWV